MIPLEEDEYYLKVCNKCHSYFGCKATCKNIRLVHQSNECLCLKCERMKLVCKRLQFEYNPSSRVDLGKGLGKFDDRKSS